jgi:hypothetical protein
MYEAYLNTDSNKIIMKDKEISLSPEIKQNLQNVACLKFIEGISFGVKIIAGVPISSMTFESIFLIKESIKDKAKGLAVLGFCNGGIEVYENMEVVEFDCYYDIPVQIGDTKDIDINVASENLRRNLQESLGIDISFVEIKISDINDSDLKKEELLNKVIVPQIVFDGLGIWPVSKMVDKGLEKVNDTGS